MKKRRTILVAIGVVIGVLISYLITQFSKSTEVFPERSEQVKYSHGGEQNKNLNNIKTKLMTTDSVTQKSNEEERLVFEGDIKTLTTKSGISITFSGGIHATPAGDEPEVGTYSFEFSQNGTTEKITFTTDESGNTKEWNGYEISLVDEWPLTLSIHKK